MKVKDHFVNILAAYEVSPAIITSLWQEIHTAYTGPDRHYHNLTHLEKMLDQLLPVQADIESWESVVLALCYHDIIYDPLSGNNEAESAALARKRFHDLPFPDKTIDLIGELIMATKGHQFSNEKDINLFTDADLSVLGADAGTYHQYAANIRKEYAVVPDTLYDPGRHKVLRHFLEMDNIFKTVWFRERYEQQARRNLEAELNGFLKA
jgi:predicted metal-dependent HD superfamily phosphohydrolase